MWAGFALTMLYALDSIKTKYFISALLGLIGGPLSYSAGVGIGSLSIQSNFAYMLLSIFWGAIVPLLFKYMNSIE